jgi:hypothetical protein
MWFPTQTKQAQVIAGFYEIDFDALKVDSVIQSIALTGPAGSTVSVYIENTFVDTTPRGDFNRADYYAGIPVPRGLRVRLVWSVGSGAPVPSASITATDGGAGQAAALGGGNSIFSQTG